MKDYNDNTENTIANDPQAMRMRANSSPAILRPFSGNFGFMPVRDIKVAKKSEPHMLSFLEIYSELQTTFMSNGLYLTNQDANTITLIARLVAQARIIKRSEIIPFHNYLADNLPEVGFNVLTRVDCKNKETWIPVLENAFKTLRESNRNIERKEDKENAENASFNRVIA